jgi:hypothetical protein
MDGSGNNPWRFELSAPGDVPIIIDLQPWEPFSKGHRSTSISSNGIIFIPIFAIW